MMENPEFERYLSLYQDMIDTIVKLHNDNVLVNRDINNMACYKVRKCLFKISSISKDMRKSLLLATRENRRQLAEQGKSRLYRRKKLSVNQKTRVRATFRKLENERAAYKIK